MKKRADQDDWSSVTWQGAEAANLRDGMKLTFAQKLRWLEEMQALVNMMKKPSVVKEPENDYDRSAD